MHAKKLKASQVSGVVLHDRRVGMYHANEQIDPTRSHLNYNLQVGDPMSLYRQRLAELTYRNRDDVVTMVSWVVTCPKELIGTEDEKRYFETMYDFLSERYGWKNVVSAFVHLDETTPHMHYKFIPVVIDNGIEKLNAKKVIYRSELSRVHKDAEMHCRKVFGREKLVLNGATDNGNKTITELKQKDLDAKLERTLKTIEALDEDLPAEVPLLEVKKGFLDSVVSVKGFNALIEQHNALISTEKARQQALNLWKERFFEENRRFKGLEDEFKRFRELDMPKELLSLREAKNALKSQNESLIEENSFLKTELEKVKEVAIFYKEALEGLFENLQNASYEFLKDLEVFLPDIMKQGFEKLLEGLFNYGNERD